MTETERKSKIIDLISFLIHQYYSGNPENSLEELLDDSFSWIGAGEEEYITGKERLLAGFRDSLKKIQKYNISNEEYQIMDLGNQVYVCSGSMRITKENMLGTCLQIQQRVTGVFRFDGERAICCHMHLSNPYMETEENEAELPFKVSPQIYEYFRRLLEKQKRHFQKREEELLQSCYEDSLTRVYNRNRFDMDMNSRELQNAKQLGIGYFDLNNLKKINDTLGHSAGDQLICRMAKHIQKYFEKKTYRIGGDEFVVIDSERDREHFENVMHIIEKNMKEDQIDCSQGFCWRNQNIHMMEQFNEADRKMYEDKKEYYNQKAKGRCQNESNSGKGEKISN